MRRVAPVLWCAAAATQFPCAVAAEKTAEEKQAEALKQQAEAVEKKKTDVFAVLRERSAIDLAVPGSPAFAVLGISPSDVQRPGTVRALAASLLRGVDENGRAKAGLAVDFAPLPLAAPKLIRGGKGYERNLLLQAATRTTVSIASTPDEKGGDASKFAWGIRTGVIDFGDPGRDYDGLVECFKATKPADLPGGRNVNPPSDAATKAADAKLEACLKALPVKPLWTQPALYVGYGRAWYSKSGKLTDTAPAMTMWWATYSQGWDRGAGSLKLLFQLHASRKTDDRVEDPNNSALLVRQDATLALGRLKAGRDDWRAYLDLGQRRLELAQTTKERLKQFGLGAEFKLKGMGDHAWLQIGSVRETGYADGKSLNKATVSIRFGSEPVFELPGS